MKMRLKIKNRSHRYVINIPRPRDGLKYIKYKMYLSIRMVYNELHLNKIYNSIQEKVKQH